jgi:hypothetical protein
MKKLILSIILAGVAFAVQAGAAKTGSDKASASCCCDDKPAKQAKPQSSATKQTKATYCTGKEMTLKHSLPSPKALADAR